MSMNNFLSLLKDARLNVKSTELEVDFQELYELAEKHEVSALVYNQIYSFSSLPADLKMIWRKQALKINAIQAMKTNRFLNLYQKFNDKGLRILVVKGLICRCLYPQPDNRPSNDEDLYVEKEQYMATEEVLLENGFLLANKSEDVSTFLDTKSGLSIELHTSLFSEDSKAYGAYQSFFKDVFEDAILHEIHGVSVYSLSHDKHMLFLMMHFIKHFLHGGVGIRQVLDILMYAEAYAQDIRWDEVYSVLKQQHVFTLMMNVFALGYKELGFAMEKTYLPKNFDENAYDYQDLLADILDAGVFGKSSMERLHSSTITLHALESGKSSVLKSLFPSLKSMKGKYSYLNSYPFLLPIAWGNRIFHYVFSKDQGSSKKTIEIGNQRIELLRKYDVIE